MFRYRYAQYADAKSLAVLQIEAKEVKAGQYSENDMERVSRIKHAQYGLETALHKGAEGIILSYNQKPICYMLFDITGHAMRIEDFYATRCPAAREQQKRVARDTFLTVLKAKKHIENVTVMSSGFARNFYLGLGFEDIPSQLGIMELQKNRIDIMRKSPQMPDFRKPASFIHVAA